MEIRKNILTKIACEARVTIITIETTNSDSKHTSKIASLECPRCMPLDTCPEGTDVEKWVEERKSASCLGIGEQPSEYLPTLVDPERLNEIRLLQNSVLRALDAAMG